MPNDFHPVPRCRQALVVAKMALCAALVVIPPLKAAIAVTPTEGNKAQMTRQWLVGLGDGLRRAGQEQQLIENVLRDVVQRSGGQWRIKQSLLQPGTYVFETPGTFRQSLSTDFDLAKLIQGIPGVVFAHPNYTLRHARQDISPTDTEFAQRQFEYLGTGTYAALNMPTTWGFTRGSADQVIAVLDSGILYNHPELRGRLLPGYDFVSLASPKTGTAESGVITSSGSNDGDGRDSDASDPGDAPPQGSVCPGSTQTDSSFHGTAVASMAIAQANNGGMVGMDWNAKILPVRVTARCGVATVADIVDAVYWSIGANRSGSNIPSNPNPATVINLSLAAEAGFFQRCPAASSDSLLTAFAEARRRNIPVVAAAGNSGGRLGFPAACPGVIAASAATSQGEYASYSSRGRQTNALTISAPGDSEGFYVAAGNSGLTESGKFGQPNPNGHNLRTIQGTSFSAPMVAGVLSLMKSIKPSVRVEDLERILGQTAKPLANQNQETCSQRGFLGLFGGSSDCQCANGVCGPGIIQPVAAIQALINDLPLPLVNIAYSRVYSGNSALVLDSSASSASGTNPLVYRWEQINGFPVGLAGANDSAVRVVSGLSNNLFELKLTVTDAQTNQASSSVVRLMSNEVNEQAFVGPVSDLAQAMPVKASEDTSAAAGNSTAAPAASTDSLVTSSSSGGGGGAFHLVALLGMAVLLGLFRKQIK